MDERTTLQPPGTGLERMPSPIGLLIADVDGTLVTRDKVLTERAAQAVRKLHEVGIAFAVTSGRPPRGMGMLVEPLHITTPIAAFNGGIYVRPDFSIIDQHPLPDDVVPDVIRTIESHGLDVWIYRGADWYVRRLDGPHVEREKWTVKFPPTFVSSFDDVRDNVVKIVGVSDDLEAVARCERDAQATFSAHVSAARSQPYYVDVTHPEANKGRVVDRLAQLLNLPTDRIAAIGDQPNDVLMFKRSGVSIAMGNASDAVKREASYVTTSYDDEGFANAVDRFVLGHRPGSLVG
jgi:Cof subfamily protein (haloacid dehalogenase superfamily)